MRFVLALLIGLICLDVRLALAEDRIASHLFQTKKCVNMGNALQAPEEGEWGHIIDTAHFERIRAVGFDTVRIPVRWSAHLLQEETSLIDPQFARRVDNVIYAALEADLNVVLNVHHFEDIMLQPDANLSKLTKIWIQLANRYRDLPPGVAFEILNEPHTALKGDKLREAQAAVIEVVRATNPTRVLILGGEDWSNVDTLGTNLATADRNVIYTFHYYDPFDFTHQNATWLGKSAPKKRRRWGSQAEFDSVAADMAKAKALADRVGRPVFLGEFGAYEAAPAASRLRYTKAVREAAEAAGIGWCVWNFTGSFPIFDVPSQSWMPGYLEALGVEAEDE